MTVSEILRRGGSRSGTSNQEATRPTSEGLAGDGRSGSGGEATSDDVTSLTGTLIRGRPAAGDACEQVSLKQDLLIRLFRGNFVAIEASACTDSPGTSFRTSSSSNLSTDGAAGRVKLCLVDDWRGVQILDLTNGSQLWPTSLQPPQSAHHDDQHQHHQHQGRAALLNETGHHHHHHHQQQATSFGLQSDGAGRLAFASATSVISLLGILANLLILLIIVINTKQKLPNFLSRGSQTSSTNYHFVLLFQLTLTGLLIGSCALLNTTSQLRHYQPPDATSKPNGAHSGGNQPLHNNNNNNNNNNRNLHHHQPVTWSQSPFAVYLDGDGDSVGDPLDSGVFLQDRQTALLISLERDGGQSEEAAGLVASDQTAEPTRAHQVFRVAHVERFYSEAWLRWSREPPFNLSRVLFDLIAAIYIWTVAGLAFDRYCAIAYPLEYLRAVSSSRARNFLLVLWLSAVLVLVLMPIGVNLLEGGATAIETDQLNVRSLLQSCGRRPSDRIEVENFKQVARDSDDDNEHESGARLVETLLAIWSGGQAAAAATGSSLAWSSESNQALHVSFSLMIFLLVVVAPLAIATICNLSIYGIVKGHERRMSASSSSQPQAAAGSGGYALGGSTGGSVTGAASFASSLRHNYWSLFRRDNSFCSTSTTTSQDRHSHRYHSHHHHHMRHCRACSSASSLSILGKLVRASQQVGASLACRQVSAMTPVARRSSSTWSSGSSGSSTGSSSSEPACGRADQEALQRLLEHRPDCEAGGARRRGFSSANSSQRSSFQSGADASLFKRRPGNSPAPPHHHHHHHQFHNQPKPMAASQLEFAAKRKLKRKLSDKDELDECTATCLGPHRNRLLLSQHSFDSPSQCGISPLCCPNAQATSPRSTWTQLLNPNSNSPQLTKQIVTQTNSSSPLDSDGIMRQLKLAGLSFAGIPINELMQTGCEARRPLNRSSSCSLGNLNAFADGARYSSPVWNTARTYANSHKFQATFRHQLDKRSSFVSLDQTSGKTKCHTQLLAGQRLDSMESLALPADGGSDSKQQRTLLGYANLCSLPAASGAGGPSTQIGPSNQQNRVQFNVVFNVVVWLILLLLACSIPQYCLLMMLELTRPTSGSPVAASEVAVSSASSVEELLDDFLLEFANKTGSGHQQPDNNHLNGALQLDPVRVGLSILSCLCDLLFLLTLPLNAWLYGIRSRSLKATLRMMLRRYISKRQASIEIDQRRKSVMLQRSRDSSIVGLIGAHSEAAQQQQQQQLACCCHREARGVCGHRQGRVVRRCASFNLPASCLPAQQLHFDEKLPAAREPESGLETSPKLERTLSASSAATDMMSPTSVKPAHANSIRFVLGDELQTSPPQTAKQMPLEAVGSRHGLLDCLLASNSPCQPAGGGGWRRPFKSLSASLDTTPAISSRSLLSASIRSSHSTALLLLNGTATLGDELKTSPFASPTAPTSQEAAAQPLAGVLKNGQRQAAMRRRQESCESAGGGSLLSGAPGGGPSGAALGHCHLARVQSSPGELALASARFRSQLEPEQANASKCHHSNDHQRRFESPAAAASQRDSNASKIKLMLTSADDETSTQEPLVGGLVEEERLHEADFVAGDDSFGAAAASFMRTTSKSQAHTNGATKLEAKQRRRADFEGAHSRQSADYCRQIKEAIARYFASSQRRRRLGSSSKQQRRRRPNQTRCSCDSRRHHRKLALEPQLASFHLEADVEPTRRLAASQAGHHHHQQQQRIKPSHSTGSFQQASAPGRPELKSRPPVHLKPPSSLKLVNLERLLTGGPTPDTYASLLALSPIKECSSNHSCASSLSSLNNVFGQPPQQKQQQQQQQ